MIFSCVNCKLPIRVSSKAFIEGVCCSHCNHHFDPTELMQYETAGQAPSAEFEPPVKPGDKLDVFEIDLELGRGSFGSVFRAKDLLLNRFVAIKIPREVHSDKRHIEILVREASIAANLRNPNIVAVHEVGQANNFAYVVSEFIDGVTLREMNSFVKFQNLEIATMMEKLSLAVHYAHGQGVIHRDLKPSNIIVDRSGEPHITDFGTAVQELPTIAPGDSTTVVGTPAYMAPEQAVSSGDSPTAQLDVYSLGAILYELLCGKLHVDGEKQEPVFESAGGREIPIPLQEICKKALSYEPEHRYFTAAEMAGDMLRYSASVTEAETQIAEHEPPTQTRIPVVANWWKGIAAGIGVFALLVCSIIMASKAYMSVPKMQFHVGDGSADSFVKFELAGSPEALSDVERITIHKFKMDSGYGFVSKSFVKELLIDDTSVEQETKLEDGVYQLNIFKKNGSQQVVERIVPTQESKPEPAEKTSAEACTAIVVWEDIKIIEPQEPEGGVVELGPEKLYLIKGGLFQNGSLEYTHPLTKMPLYPMQEVQVADFYVAKAEVTVANFEQVMGFVPSPMQERFENGIVPKDIPVTNVSFAKALEYCERIGARLPSLEEYFYVASNKGTTTFPWGDEPQAVSKSDLGRRLDFENDVTLLLTKITGLYSGALEWTTEVNLPPLSGLKLKQIELIRRKASNSRVVVGGTLSEIKSNEVRRIRQMKGVRCFGSVGIDKSPSDFQGFRVYF